MQRRLCKTSIRTMLALSICVFCLLPVYGSDLEDGRAAIAAGDFATALRLLEPLAGRGDHDAENALGVLYSNGWGVARDYQEAFRWFRMAADYGHAKAQSNLGMLYAGGKGVEQDYAMAATLYRLAAEQGYTTAQIRLGLLYDEGHGVRHDYAEAVRWYRMAAQQGDATAQGLMGIAYATGRGVGQDYSLAMTWYRKSAEQGNPASQYNLGYMYEHGEGVVPDEVEATRWYQLAADQGYEEAAARLQMLADAKGPHATREPTSDDALVASAADLAQSYMNVKYVTEFLIPAAEAGATVYLPDAALTESTVAEHKPRYERRLSTYRDAITRRGYETVAGTYRGRTTESCGRIHSLWVQQVHEGTFSGIEIVQDGFDARLIVKVDHDGEEFALENPAAITESAISVCDAGNSDYYFRGVIRNGSIEINPNVSVLDSWPQWAGPPSRENLLGCTITLEQE